MSKKTVRNWRTVSCEKCSGHGYIEVFDYIDNTNCCVECENCNGYGFVVIENEKSRDE